ncbi:MAG TPA: hypothetical protein VK764_02360 [Terracidiphilus sp.]|nr:hypothetical protein [Terracidiphilus sp.]
MRSSILLLCGAIVGALAAGAQDPPQAGSTPSPAGVPVIHVPDGGAGGRMESIFIPPKAGAPFNLKLTAEWTRQLGNGGNLTLANERRIVRDGRGRIYQERWLLVPKGGAIKSTMDIFQITDPEQHTWFNCETRTKVCDLMKYNLTTEAVYGPATGKTGPLPDGKGSRRHEDLGTRMTQGVETHGYRETVTLNPGVMGNDAPMETVREFWYAPDLGIDILSTVDAPLTGKQVFTVKEISLGEPEATWFLPPDDYKVVDHREERE